MKHLLLYEAFKSKGISKTLKFLSEKGVGKYDFLNELKKILEIYKFPISEFTDDDIHYMNSSKAKNIEIPDGYEIMNPWGVYALKFWFSLEEGYLTKSGIGYDLSKSLDHENINKIKEEFGFKKGTLTPVTVSNLKKLKTGDIVFGYFDDTRRDYKFSKAIIFKENDRVFAIQNVSDGNAPSSNDWKSFGEYSWVLSSMNDDTVALHLWVDGDHDLKIDGGVKYTSDLSVNRNGKLGSSVESYIKKSDFALVIYLDNLIKYDSIEDIRSERTESRSGATALMSNEEIKKINYDKYMASLLVKKGIHKDSKYDDLKNLQNIVSNFLLGEWVLITLYKRVPDYRSKIVSLYQNIELLIKEEDKEYYLNRLVKKYKNSLEDCDSYKKNFLESEKMVRDIGNKDTIFIFEKFLKLSRYLRDKISSTKIDTIDDLVILLYKLNSINEYMNDDRVEFQGGFYGILSNFHYADNDVDYSTRKYNDYSSELDRIENLRRVDLIKKFIDRTLTQYQ
jgi:hypothetical protein